MARQKFSSPALKKLSTRLNGLKAIHPAFRLNRGASIETGEILKAKLQQLQDDYNIKLSEVDNKRREIAQAEAEAEEFSKMVFNAVKAEFGEKSAEYETVGGRVAARKPKKVEVK